MSQNNKSLNMIKWAARISAVAIIAFGLPFYFGYGNPLLLLTLITLYHRLVPFLVGVLYLIVGYKVRRFDYIQLLISKYILIR